MPEEPTELTYGAGNPSSYAARVETPRRFPLFLAMALCLALWAFVMVAMVLWLGGSGR
jgi:hypothetical protein